MANVNFYRDTKANIDNIAYTDGQMYFPTDQNKIYLDTGNQRKQYGGDTEVDSDLSTTSTNPVQNKIVTTSLNQKVEKTDVVNDLASAVAVTATNVPVGCGAIKELNESISVGTETFYYDVQDGVRGYNTSPTRGADTFYPFSKKLIQKVSCYHNTSNNNAYTYINIDTTNISTLYCEKETGHSVSVYNSDDDTLLLTIPSISTSENIDVSSMNKVDFVITNNAFTDRWLTITDWD